MQKLAFVEQVEVDSTATAYLKTKGDSKPDKGAMESAMGRHKVKSLKRVKRPNPAAVYLVTLKGMS